MQITVGSTITVEQPSSELVQWCEKNLVISNPDYAKKLRMHFWLGNTPKELCLYEIHGDSLVLPFGVLRDILPYVSSAKVFRTFTERTKVNYECSVPLYDYQQTAVEVRVIRFPTTTNIGCLPPMRMYGSREFTDGMRWSK